MAFTERRKSDRLMLTIPLTVRGVDAKGETFEAPAQSLDISRQGVRIQVSYPLRSHQNVRLVNPLGRREAEFRVVGPVAPLTEKGGVYALECAQADTDFWGIKFPPLSDHDSSEAKGLLECRKCHTVAVLRLSLTEYEVLQTIGLLGKPCPVCKAVSPWGYADMRRRGLTQQPQAGDASAGREVRQHRRVALQMPLLIRDYYGGVEITQSENVSRQGFCFTGEKDYFPDQAILVTLPYSPTTESVEQRSVIVRRGNTEGSTRKVYGVRYMAFGGSANVRSRLPVATSSSTDS